MASPNRLAVVYVEGGETRVRRFERLLLNRIKWQKPDDQDDEQENDSERNDAAGPCHIVWQG